MDTLVCLMKDFIHVDIMWCKYGLVRNTLQVDIEILNSCRQSYDKCLRFSFSKKQKKQTLIAVFRIFTKNASSPPNLIIQSQLQLYRYLIHKSFENAFWICRISTRLGWIIHEHKVKNSNTHPIFDSWFTEKDPASRHSKNKLFCNLSYLKVISYREFS